MTENEDEEDMEARDSLTEGRRNIAESNHFKGRGELLTRSELKPYTMSSVSNEE